MIIGANVGYGYTKFCSNKGLGIFPSTYVQGSMALFDNNVQTINYRGIEYTVGITRKAQYRNTFDSTDDLAFLLPLYCTIARNMERETEETRIVTGLPISLYGKLKDDVTRQLRGSVVPVKYNGLQRNIIIKDVLVFPEAAGYPLIHPEVFKGADVLVIDIGTMTCDVAEFDCGNGEPRIVQYKSYPLGLYQLYTGLAKEVAVNLKEPFSTWDMEKITRQGYVQYNGERREMNTIERHKENHLNNIMLEMRNDFPVNRLSKAWIGGGSSVLSDYIKEPVTKDTVFDNAKIFYTVGVKKFE